MKHGMADIEPGLRLHYVEAGERGARTIVLVHGFPQTWLEWRHVIPGLVDAGWHVVAPDYRGAGSSWRPAGGYDKVTVAGDIRTLVRERLGVAEPVVVVGHDIGLMVAFAYATRFREEVARLVVVDAPLPGTNVFDRLRADPRVWHFAFHGARDLAELLVSGREREYLRFFFDARTTDPSAIAGEAFDAFVSAYAMAGAMRAGFELYRAFDQDAADNRAAVASDGKLAMPVLAVGGERSTSGAFVEEMMCEVASDVTGVVVPGTAHWIPEEDPDAFLEALLSFAG